MLMMELWRGSVCEFVHVRMRERSSPECTEAHAANHVEERVKYDHTQQQIEEHGLWGGDRERQALLQRYQTPNPGCMGNGCAFV